MSAVPARKSKRPPTFYWSDHVDIDIDPEDLEAAGWRYVGKGEGADGDVGPTEEQAVDIVRRWHDETHDGPWQWCAEQPCDTLRGRPHDGRDS